MFGGSAWREDWNYLFRDNVGIREDGLGDGEIGASVVDNEVADLLVNAGSILQRDEGINSRFLEKKAPQRVLRIVVSASEGKVARTQIGFRRRHV